MPHILSVSRGICQTQYGFLVHWKTSEENTAWDHMCELLPGPEHYVKLYTSALMKDKAMEQTQQRELLGEIIDVIG